MVKMVSLSERAYAELSKIKKDKSFSEVILHLLYETKVSNKERVLSFFGAGGIDETAIWDLRKDWKKWSKKYA